MAVDKLVDSAQLDADLTSVANAIRTKGGTSAQLEFPNGFVDAVEAIPTDSGNPVASLNDVVFVDYDGEVRYSYTAEEFLALTELPNGPVHDGLVFDGWNWELTDAKEYVSKYWELIIGAYYYPVGDWNEVVVDIPVKLSLCIRMEGQTNGEPLLVDWGDGSDIEQHSISAGTLQRTPGHIFEPGTYTIRIKYSISGASQTGFVGIRIDGTPESNNNNFVAMNLIKEIHVSKQDAYYDRITAYGAKNAIAFSAPYGRRVASLFSADKISTWFGQKRNTEAGAGPDYGRVKWISFCINERNGGGGGGCYNNVAWICLQEVSTCGNIGGNCLTHLRIPATIQTMPNSFLSSIYGCSWVQFYPTVPPTAQGSNTFNNMSPDCAFIVPVASLDDYLVATNYPGPSTYLYLGWYRGTAGETLPTVQGKQRLTRYQSIEDAKAQTNPVTTMQGREVFCRYA